MYWRTEGIKNRLGLAMAAVSSDKRPKIRVERRGWVLGLTGGFSYTKGKNYRIKPQEKDELVKTCEEMLEGKKNVAIEKTKAQIIAERIKVLTGGQVSKAITDENYLKKDTSITDLIFYKLNIGKTLITIPKKLY